MKIAKMLLSAGLLAVFIIIAGYIFIPADTTSQPIRIGLNPWPGYEFFYLAEKKGFYKQLGVDVDIVEYSSLEDVRYAFEKGQIDIMNSTIIEVLLSDERTNKKPKAFFVSDFSNGGDVIIAKSNYNSIKDLKNKNIAVEPNSLGLYMLARALQKENMSINDVNMVGLTQLEMENAFKSGEVDAIVSYPPVSIEINKNIPNVRTVFTSADIPGEIIDIASAEESFIENKKNELKKILIAWDLAVEYSEKNPDDAYTIMAKRERISAKEFSEVIGDMKILRQKDQKQYLKPSGPVEKAIIFSVEVLIETGFIKKEIVGKDLINRNLFSGVGD